MSTSSTSASYEDAGGADTHQPPYRGVSPGGINDCAVRLYTSMPSARRTRIGPGQMRLLAVTFVLMRGPTLSQAYDRLMTAARSATKSKFVVYAALAGNLAVAAVKFAAATYTGSTAMLSEAVHSLVDTGNQGLLLFGLREAAQRPTASHPFGHGLRLYFWSFVVAILIFGLGAGVSVLEGIDKIRAPRPVTDMWINYTILGVAALIEGGTLFVGLREFRRTKGRRGWFEALRHSKDPSVFTVVLEDSSALSGLLIAFAGLLLTQRLDAPVCDGIASVTVGLLLGSAACFLAAECHGLLTGEAAAPEICDSVRALAVEPGVERVNDVLSMHFGPNEVLLALSIEFKDQLSGADIQNAVTRIERRIQNSHPEMRRIFVEAQRADAHRSGLQVEVSDTAV